MKVFEIDPVECPECGSWGPHRWLNNQMTEWECEKCGARICLEDEEGGLSLRIRDSPEIK